MDDPHARLERAMREQMFALRIKTWRDLATAADISYETLRALRKGRGRPADATALGIERVLHWQRGSIEAVLAGGDPTPIGGEPPTDSGQDDELSDDPDELMAEAAASLARSQALMDRAMKILDRRRRA